MDYKSLILKNKSVREYKKTAVKQEALDTIRTYAQSCKQLVSGIATEVLILDHEHVYHRLENIAGYKGHMIEAPHYIIILSENKKNAIENAGYLGQKLIWKAVELEVDNCWITFQDGKKIVERLGLDASKEAVALIALGYGAAGSKGTIVNGTKTGGNYSKAEIEIVKEKEAYRLAVEEIVFQKKWGQKADVQALEDHGLLDAFYFSRLAPSTLNRQPWRFLIDDGKVILAVRNDEYIITYEEKIDAGIVMLYFETMVESTLFEINWKMEKPEKDYQIPAEYEIVGYCNT